MRIGFIGLGVMGRPMAANLIAAGHDLVVSGHSTAAAQELAGLGAAVAGTPRAVAADVELVLTMLPNSPQVREVALGRDGLLHSGRPGLLYADMSSIAPAVLQEVGAALAVTGVRMLDAPVSGGEPKAVDGTLSFMVGGEKEVFDRVSPVLAAMGSSVVHVGELGAGNVTKLANQVVVALNIAAVSEALVLAQMSGVAPETVLAAIRGGLAGSTVMEAKAPMMLEHRFRPGFRIDLHIKDLANALDSGGRVGAPLPLTSAVFSMLTVLAAEGHEKEDHSALVRYYESLGDTRIDRR